MQTSRLTFSTCNSAKRETGQNQRILHSALASCTIEGTCFTLVKVLVCGRLSIDAPRTLDTKLTHPRKVCGIPFTIPVCLDSFWARRMWEAATMLLNAQLDFGSSKLPTVIGLTSGTRCLLWAYSSTSRVIAMATYTQRMYTAAKGHDLAQRKRPSIDQGSLAATQQYLRSLIFLSNLIYDLMANLKCISSNT